MLQYSAAFDPAARLLLRALTLGCCRAVNDAEGALVRGGRGHGRLGFFGWRSTSATSLHLPNQPEWHGVLGTLLQDHGQDGPPADDRSAVPGRLLRRAHLLCLELEHRRDSQDRAVLGHAEARRPAFALRQACSRFAVGRWPGSTRPAPSAASAAAPSAWNSEGPQDRARAGAHAAAVHTHARSLRRSGREQVRRRFAVHAAL